MRRGYRRNARGRPGSPVQRSGEGGGAWEMYWRSPEIFSVFIHQGFEGIPGVRRNMSKKSR
eukprot:148123-Amorphochlora_amoeboformis.AAC.2